MYGLIIERAGKGGGVNGGITVVFEDKVVGKTDGEYGTILFETGENADSRLLLGALSVLDVTKIEALVESSGLTGGVGNRSMPFSSMRDSVARTKSL